MPPNLSCISFMSGRINSSRSHSGSNSRSPRRGRYYSSLAGLRIQKTYERTGFSGWSYNPNSRK